MNSQRFSASTFVETWLERGWNPLIEDANRFVQTSQIHQLSSSQLNRLRKLFHEASNLETITKFINKQTERDEKRGGDKWTKVASKLKAELDSASHKRDRLKADLLEFAKSMRPLQRELETFFNSQDKNQIEQVKLELARRFFTAVYAICRCKREKIKVQIEEVKR